MTKNRDRSRTRTMAPIVGQALREAECRIRLGHVLRVDPEHLDRYVCVSCGAGSDESRPESFIWHRPPSPPRRRPWALRRRS